jgi:hypothetical protein
MVGSNYCGRKKAQKAPMNNLAGAVGAGGIISLVPLRGYS